VAIDERGRGDSLKPGLERVLWRGSDALLKGRMLDALQVAASYGFFVGVLALGLVAALSSATSGFLNA